MVDEPELKAIIQDIIAKYIYFINADILKDSIYNMVEKRYQAGLDHGEIQFNRNFLPSYQTVSFIQKYSFDNVKGLTEETKEALRKQMSQGLMNKESIPQLKLRIIETMDASIARAEMIARTESNRAFNMGHYQAAKDSGLKVLKQWSAQNERTSKAGNEVPCPKCESMDGMIIGMNDKFNFSDGEELLLPPKHPHCACRVLYIQ
jgi:SPP1 gp7 family putative phage head morphogenesis protein